MRRKIKVDFLSKTQGGQWPANTGGMLNDQFPPIVLASAEAFALLFASPYARLVVSDGGTELIVSPGKGKAVAD